MSQPPQAPQPSKRSGRMVKRILIIGLVVFVLIQFIPIFQIENQAESPTEPPWDSPATRATFMRSCADCHSNNTTLPWYSNLAPVSWFLGWHVNEGRKHFNVSTWPPRGKSHADDAAEEVAEGNMPLKSYLLLHPEARLTGEERREFAKGLERTFGKKGSGEKDEHEEGGGEKDHEH